MSPLTDINSPRGCVSSQSSQDMLSASARHWHVQTTFIHRSRKNDPSRSHLFLSFRPPLHFDFHFTYPTELSNEPKAHPRHQRCQDFLPRPAVVAVQSADQKHLWYILCAEVMSIKFMSGGGKGRLTWAANTHTTLCTRPCFTAAAKTPSSARRESRLLERQAEWCVS